jgi:hypothetical protein
MSTKKSLLLLSFVFLLVLAFAAMVHADLTSMLAVDSLFAQISAGDLQQTQDLFAEDAVFTNKLTGRSCEGFAEIAVDLTPWQHPGRAYEIISMTEDGDTVKFVVEVSDHNVVWASQRMTAELNDNLIQNLELDGIRLLSFPYKKVGDSS